MKNTNSANTNSVETRGRKFNVSRHAVSRAWEIAKNATVAHNTNPLNVALKGLVKPSEFLADSLKIGWKEAKAKQAKIKIDTYKLHSVPKKSLTKILNTVAETIAANGLVKISQKDTVSDIITKAVGLQSGGNLIVATEIFKARYSTVCAASTNRHTLHALEEVAYTGSIPEHVADKVAY